MRLLVVVVVLVVASLLSTAGSARADHAWTVGLRATAQHLAPDAGDEADTMELRGGGLQARWRFLPSWGLEVSLEALRGELAGGDFRRDSGALTVTAMWHPFGLVAWDFYVLAGIGGTGDTVTLRGAGDREIEQSFEQTHVHLGIGLEHLWRHWGLGIEVRAVGLARQDQDEARAGDAVPPSSAGAQWSLTLGYYF